MTTCAQPDAEERSFLERSIPWWHVSFVVVLAITAFVNLLTPGLPVPRRALVLVLLAGLGVLYVLLGRRLLFAEEERPRLATFYLVLLGATTCTVIATTDGASYLLLFIVFPHIWALLNVRWAIAASAVFVIAIMILQVRQYDGFPANVLGPLTNGVLMLGLAVLMGVWLSGIIAESERRQALIVELEGTRAELAAAHHREGVLAERERLATEIHDTLAQGFMSIVMLSRTPGSPEQLAKIERTASDNLAEARSLIDALQPDELRDGTLADACRRVVERFDAETDDVLAHFVLDGEPRTLPPNTEVVLLRATQEALANVRKHARASSVEVCLRYADHRTTIRIRDDGAGFDPSLPTVGFGLRGMRTRAAQIAGKVEICSEPARGTVVEVEVP